MKKEKSLNFLSSKWLMVTFLALGILFFSSSAATAQNQFDEKITELTELRDSFAPSSAKYDIAQEAIDYLEVLIANINANPEYLYDLADITGNTDPLTADKIRKAHVSILANYSTAELANFTQLNAEYTAPLTANAILAQKTQWVLDANAY